MARTRRRRLACVLVVSLAVTAGCGGTGGDTATTTHDPESGYIQAEAVDAVPENETVVNYSSDAVGDSERLETALRRAVDSNETVVVPLDGDEIDRAYDALDDAPGGSDAYQYVRYDDAVVKVVVAVAA